MLYNFWELTWLPYVTEASTRVSVEVVTWDHKKDVLVVNIEVCVTLNAELDVNHDNYPSQTRPYND